MRRWHRSLVPALTYMLSTYQALSLATVMLWSVYPATLVLASSIRLADHVPSGASPAHGRRVLRLLLLQGVTPRLAEFSSRLVLASSISRPRCASVAGS